MAKIKIQLEHAEAKTELTGILTAGMVGVPVRFAFGHVWNGLVKTAVFQGSGETVVQALLNGEEASVPWEVLACPGSTLRIGVEGRSSNGEVVIPSTMAEVGKILEGADPRGTEPGEPAQPVWAQIMAKLDALEQACSEERVNALIDAKLADLPAPEAVPVYGGEVEVG